MNYKLTRQELETEITQLKKINELLLKSLQQEEIRSKENNKYFHSILNCMGDPVFVKDDQSRLVFISDSFCDVFGISRENILGRTLAEHVSEKEREDFLKIDKQVLSDGIENISEESLTIRGAKQLVISTRKMRLIDSDGNKFVIGVINDVTKRKKAEDAFKQGENKFRELNLTKDKLLSIIGHDLRTPFSNILVLSEIISSDLKDGDDAKVNECLNMMSMSAKDGLTMLENLLNWAQSQTGQLNHKIEKVSLSGIVHEVIKQSSLIAKTKSISLKIGNCEDVNFHTDVRMLKTVLRNLISNAIKFTNLGGEVSILTKPKDNYIEISVSDNGVGIPDRIREKLFDASSDFCHSSFGTANESGTGFGLVLCKEFTEKLGGKIWVESEEGKGSDFKILLPFIQ
ncbi:PAS domain-containing sensor histidine kinase [Cellulophaga sp. HaHaR_3_176]|nr:PAS domain-containing sensor histidine kinase [Cellulophaga sp. HaHaR_3_176]